MPIPVKLLDQNPWWRDPTAIRGDKDLVALDQAKIKWEPRLKHAFRWDEDLVYTLRGPRQVGKTTLVKQKIAELVSAGDPRNVFYYTCNLVDSARELAEIVTEFLDSAEGRKGRKHVFIDEVSSVRDWQKAIKHLADTGKLVNTTMVLTGSHTIDIKAASERLPGRRGMTGDSLDKILLPMKFAEYAETVDGEVKKLCRRLSLLPADVRRKCVMKLADGEIPAEVDELHLYLGDLTRLFEDYLITGGLARVVDEYSSRGGIREAVYKTYLDAVMGDLSRWNKREAYVRQVLSRVIATVGTPVGWNTLRQSTDIASHSTVAEYIDTIKDTFALIYLHRLDSARGVPAYQKEKKVYFPDPFFFHTFRAWTTGHEPFADSLEFLKRESNLGVLSECVVADHLTRLAFSLAGQRQMFDYQNTLFYWKGRTGREVDFVMKLTEARYLPIEVKYQRQINVADRFGLIDFAKANPHPGRSIMLTKDVLGVRSKSTLVPVCVFLMLI